MEYNLIPVSQSYLPKYEKYQWKPVGMIRITYQVHEFTDIYIPFLSQYLQTVYNDNS